MTEGKRPVGRSRRRWEENIKMDLKEIGVVKCGLDLFSSGQVPVASSRVYGNESLGSIRGKKFADQLNNYYLTDEIK
jgi:hypothetical protein